MNDIINRAVRAAIEDWKNDFKGYVNALNIPRDDYKGIMEYIDELPSAQPGQRNARVFQGIIVEYPSYCVYPEYKGKPYFSIKYTENGQEFIGYGTYKPEVLSEYLKEYFMPLAQPGWIPVTERLPEEDTEVLVTVYFMGLKQTSPSGWNDHIKPNYYVDLASRIGDDWSSASDEYKVARDRHKVVAWQPKPKPYREGGQDETD